MVMSGMGMVSDLHRHLDYSGSFLLTFLPVTLCYTSPELIEVVWRIFA